MNPYRIPFAKLELVHHMIQQGGSFVCPVVRGDSDPCELRVSIELEQGGKHFTASFPYVGKLHIIRIPVTGSAHLALAEWIEDAVNGRLDADEMLEASEAYAEQDHAAEPSSMAAEMVDHPAHYNRHPSGIECIDVVEHMAFSQGNAFKYLFRRAEKGELRENLRKAQWYIDRANAKPHLNSRLGQVLTTVKKITDHEPEPFASIMLNIALGSNLALSSYVLAIEIAKLDA